MGEKSPRSWRNEKLRYPFGWLNRENLSRKSSSASVKIPFMPKVVKKRKMVEKGPRYFK